jgi:phosphohistidine phosphatase
MDAPQAPWLELLLLRHGIAEPGTPDALRPLSPAGRQRTSAVVERLVQRQLQCSRLFSSPLRRAWQTAELAVAGGLAPAIECAEALAPQGAALAWLKQLAAGAPLDGQRWLLVGHEPDLSDLVAQVLAAPPACVQLKKAGVAMLQWQPQQTRARLLLLATPKLLLQ